MMKEQVESRKVPSKVCMDTIKEEEELVLSAYHKFGNWDATLTHVKRHIADIHVSNLARKENVVEYYFTSTDKVAIKRMQRIVNQRMKKTTPVENATSSYMVSAIKNSKMRYAMKMTPEERAQKKFEFVNDSSQDDEDIGDYSENMDSMVCDEDSENPGDDVACSSKKGKKKKIMPKKANEAHTYMCQKTMNMIDKINRMLDKFDNDSD
ncbi:hypothetical protein AC249_AIPGENE12488 [Exaiptasia diaphana]|nr:hypothetical protein AC249_AIPGENE12488 [Exaiptasia diaphana]